MLQKQLALGKGVLSGATSLPQYLLFMYRRISQAGFVIHLLATGAGKCRCSLAMIALVPFRKPFRVLRKLRWFSSKRKKHNN
jgi:hypothetical protein